VKLTIHCRILAIECFALGYMIALLLIQLGILTARRRAARWAVLYFILALFLCLILDRLEECLEEECLHLACSPIELLPSLRDCVIFLFDDNVLEWYF